MARLAVAVCAAAALAAPPGCGDRGEPADASARPNVVMIVMDTTRADRCSLTGYARPTTPHLDRLGERGSVFLDCWSPSPWTGPAHASLFTGRRPVRHGFSEAHRMLVDEEVTLAELLGAAGYATACFAGNTFVSPSFGITQGFQRFANPSTEKGLPESIAEVTHAAAGDWALAAHARGQPFFLFINDMEPHTPYTPPDEAVRRVARFAAPQHVREAATFVFPRPIAYSIGALELPREVITAASDLYDGEIASLDQQIGLLLERLRLGGALDDALVVVAGDHGECLGDHGLVGHAFGIHANLLHVPLLIWRPGTVPVQRVTETVRLEDVFPTVLEVCGVDGPDDIDGASLLSDLGGRIARATVDRPLNALRHAKDLAPDADLSRFDVDLSSVYDGRFHMIRASNGKEWLFDVRADPREVIDLAGSESEAVHRLRPLLDR